MVRIFRPVLQILGLLFCPVVGFAMDAPSVLGEAELSASLLKSLLVLGAIWALSRLALRQQRKKPRAPGRLNLLESKFIERGQRLVLVQVDKRELLIACTGSQISLLACLKDEAIAPAQIAMAVVGKSALASEWPLPINSNETQYAD